MARGKWVGKGGFELQTRGLSGTGVVRYKVWTETGKFCPWWLFLSLKHGDLNKIPRAKSEFRRYIDFNNLASILAASLNSYLI